MDSPIWKASSTGDVQGLGLLLKDAPIGDIEVKDHTGITPLIEAIRNGHVEVVKLLLDHGADPTNPSSNGPPKTYATDETILDLLDRKISSSADAQQAATPITASYDGPYPPAPAGYYGPMQGTYYYPAVQPGMLPEGAVYYPPAPPNLEGNSDGPPLPCRFYPACRFGSACRYAHPPVPFFQGPLPPPAQYPMHYDQMQAQPMQSPPFSQSFYPVGPPYIPPNSAPVQPHSNGDMTSPHHGPFSPSYNVHPQNFHPVPVPMAIPLLPPPQQTPVYANPSPAFVPRQDQYTNGHYPQKLSTPQPDSNQPYRDSTHLRRGGRGSFAGRKPPCLFFPSGRCKNGDDCRYPHILPDSTTPQPYFSRSGAPRLRGNGHTGSVNGFDTLDEKLSGMTIRETPNGHGGWDNNRGRGGGPTSFKPVNGPVKPADKRPAFRQRVPNPDEFPTLVGAATSPARSPKNNVWALPNGSTAAQVLQAPPPVRKDSAKNSTRSASPDVVSNDKIEQHSIVKPASFAAVANGKPAPEVSVSA